MSGYPNTGYPNQYGQPPRGYQQPQYPQMGQYQQAPQYGYYPNQGQPQQYPQQPGQPGGFAQYPNVNPQYNMQQKPAVPQNNQPVNAGPSRNYSGQFIPPAMKPTRSYLPPPKQPLPFKFSPANEAGCAYLFGAIQALQVLLEEFANGNVDEDQKNTFLPKLTNQFMESLKMSKLDITDINDFALACELDADLALDYISELARNNPKNKPKHKDVNMFGDSVVTASDSAEGVVGTIRDSLISLQIYLMRVCPSNCQQVANSKVETWMNILKTKQSSDKLSQDEIQRFRNDIADVNDIVMKNLE
ncbi:hypothetical protein TVAG_358270 [Trichomonas vaginalis G3]|uniref:Uncharacterized protein n=1 Tax=Trichomonas vaginalis (strain ATCC PRA-98 / G3) TaxID=412133 RepID=A2ELD5_TRIV3|nr:hypothetical protein TVAGG3_0274500 [Trichomonas vaginalis G3]EAY06537.1 hypothetical protein TVAG_358270 [Trichomonas vaginalis G3]KAI5526106.1 hypothetical protein TVAGG3_0274500 [Trichomonas vaginalis G3]|eukprot:XP_001318760.1 hypothetical protein [Trichomonas vaginalis G3]